MEDLNEMNTMLKQLRNNEINTAKSIALEGISKGLEHLGLSVTSRDTFIELIKTGQVNTLIEDAADKIVVKKIGSITKEFDTQETSTTPTVHEQIEVCDKSKDKLEALGLWVYDIDLKKNKSFDNMVQDLIKHVENKE